ncbi:MAG: Holliday junction branch migration protein RuvA [Acidimicrobiales bacterium]|jgi:Holliday junction DNA helicase RuvA|nr:Holliday junction branch migration protein RuvA [Acidimicrobiales bacterium]MDP6650316.1 Holliday junction branch migration protein RuvA [Acidimicrobiales bacterium]MDP6759193.1 Holliday junction branch migration protein RuvA [Acidimicrobiales bacterium]|tara:strand:- start:44005 stop:44601 length:597 start_codon:yes stop_codon:yes gene_type:complete
MIGSLRGHLLECGEDGLVLLEVAGVGYRITVTPTTAYRLGEASGDEVFVHIHHHIREADQALYGFLERPERACFEALLSAHGVGPALALAVLGVHGPDELARVVAIDDIAALCLVPGIGRKTAARLLVDLKGTLDLPVEVVPDGSEGSGGSRSALAEVQGALGGLGYSPDEVRTVLADLAGDDPADLLREALRRLART